MDNSEELTAFAEKHEHLLYTYFCTSDDNNIYFYDFMNTLWIR